MRKDKAKMGIEALKGILGRDENEKPSFRVRAALILGAAAMLLILLSDFVSCGRSEDKQQIKNDTTAQQYTQQVEKELSDIISQMDGAGKTSVMITLDSGIEYIYASEEARSTEQSQSSGSDGRADSGVSSDSKSSYIVIKGENGEEALVRTQLMPRIGGVVVLCEGADDPQLAESIRQLTATALGISSRRVCVARLAG